MDDMRAALYYGRATGRDTWRGMLLVAIVCGILGAITLAALAGARRTESAYGRYLNSIDSSDVYVNVPSPDTALDARVASLPGIASSSVWLGLDADPVVHGHVDDAFLTNGFAGSVNGELFTQDRMTVLEGRLPPLDSKTAICLTPGLAKLFGVGVGGTVRYRFFNALSTTNSPTGYSTYRVAAIVALPPALDDQFDQVQSGVIPPAATAAAMRRPGALSFSWVGVRLRNGGAGVDQFESSLDHLAARVGHGYLFAVRQLDLVHQQVQDAIRPQAFAVGAFGAIGALAMLVIAGQALSQLLERSTIGAATLRAMGLRRREVALACGLRGAAAVVAGIALAVGGAVVLSPLAPVGPVRSIDPARGFRFDAFVLLGGGALLLVLLLVLLAWISWRASMVVEPASRQPSSRVVTALVASGFPVTAALGASYGLEPPPGRTAFALRASLIGSFVAVMAVVSSVVFAASLNGLITHPSRYGWNWNVLLQSQGGYGSFLPNSVNASDLGDGDGPIDQLMASTPGIFGWSTFGFAQVPIDGKEVPLLGLATHGGTVEPPTVIGHPLTDTRAETIGGALSHGPNEIELGLSTLHELGKRIGSLVTVGTGPTARKLVVVGVVTLPSIGVTLSDHVSLGRGGMLAESTLLSIEDLSALNPAPAEAFSALPSTLAIDVRAHTDPSAVVSHIVAALNRDGANGGVYEHPRVLGAAVVNAGQMGAQPVTLAISLALAVLISLAAMIVAATRRRRRELAVLKAIGLVRAQLRAVVGWQALTVLAIAMLVGIPLGIAGGRWAWATFASSLGVVPVISVPGMALLVGALIAFIGGYLLGLVPAALAARTPTTRALRAE